MNRLLRIGFVLVIVGVIAFGSLTFAGKPPKPGPGGCPRDIACADIWNPVQCADGIIYSNQCYADRACAPGPCVPVDGGPTQ